jgi:hypothetical protein
MAAIFKMLEDQKDAILHFNEFKYPKLSIKTKYGRKSGDPNTSIGNTIINALTFYNIFNEDPTSYAFMLGDDNLFASNKLYSQEDIIGKYK